MLYGTGDFLGGLATRRSQALLVLAPAETAGVIVALPAAAEPRPCAQATRRRQAAVSRGAASFVAKQLPLTGPRNGRSRATVDAVGQSPPKETR